MTQEPRISVILPAYNDEVYVDAAVQSILGQTFADFELLIFDDGSTDQTPEILDRLARYDDRIKVIHQENMGLIATLNKGLDMATGEFVARMDSDDISLPTRFAEQVAFLDKHPDHVLVGTFVDYVDGDGKLVKLASNVMPSTDGQIRTWLLFDNRICHPATMFRRDAIEKNQIRYRGWAIYAEDYQFFLELMNTGKAHNIPHKLFLYRRHGANVSNRHTTSQNQTRADIICKRFEQLGITLTIEDAMTLQAYWRKSYEILPSKYAEDSLRIFSLFFDGIAAVQAEEGIPDQDAAWMKQQVVRHLYWNRLLAHPASRQQLIQSGFFKLLWKESKLGFVYAVIARTIAMLRRRLSWKQLIK